jgi:hypothetical protein
MMDEFTGTLLQGAYDDCVALRRRSDPITAAKLMAAMGRNWVHYRDILIESWADRLTLACKAEDRSDEELEALLIPVDNSLCDTNLHWEVPLWDTDDAEERAALRDEQITFIAWGIACLWWVANEGNAIAPILRYTEDEVQAWLAAKLQAERYVVRRRTRTGDVVTQHAMFAQ